VESTLTPAKLLAAQASASAGIAREDFEGIVRAHQRRIYRVLLGIVRDPDTADTLTQECFLRAYRSRHSFRGESSVATWLVRIAVRLAIDHGRSRRNRFWRQLFGRAAADESAAGSSAAEELPDAGASPERQLVAREQADAVWAAVDRLSPQQRAAFLLRFVEEMKLEEIAQAMALEVGTVKAHLSRAVGALRKRLKENGIYAPASDR
jgi:RNA polymerase sigma-70 factor (ECF subfamily)